MMTPTSTKRIATSETHPKVTTSLIQRAVLAKLEAVVDGQLTIHGEGGTYTFGRAAADLPHARIEIHNREFWGALAFRGSIGAGEAFAKGWWTSESPTDVVRLFARNRAAVSGMERGLARLTRPLFGLYHSLRRNNERGSKSNISAHYDLSNEFFALFLDESMTYSCGFYESEQATLQEASIAKIDRLCQKLELRQEDHLLEIGTGWGAFAIHAAKQYGCRVTTTTISKEQHALAEARIREAQLEDRITLLFQDYRELEGEFDKIVSVEMIEAVGAAYYPAFFSQCSRLLRPGGKMALQAITIADQNFESARRSVDFIQRHIFPGSCIPSVTALCTAMTKSSDLRLTGLEDIGAHYVRTLASWRANLKANRTQALSLGYSEEFLRLWEFYFAYCEGGFAERAISDVHMILEGPGVRPGH
jgi:cyclopropane-fatty-acyl-phospholipid synthase